MKGKLRVSKFLQKGYRGIDELLFPLVCLRCGIDRTLPHQYLCPFCLEQGFEEANPRNQSNASNEFMPQKVDFQDALWKYHKGGSLQQLMYHLKYDHKARLGNQLGVLTASRCKRRPFMKEWLSKSKEIVIVPVPLHPAKMRIRGFNQARRIAEGVAEVLELEIIDKQAVCRLKKTGTQTGFSFHSRLLNMRGAFKVCESNRIGQSCQLIVDDVFTTGSTVFELANELRMHQSRGIGILTVAQA